MPDQTLGGRLKHAWSVFRNRDPTARQTIIQDVGYGSSIRQDKRYRRSTNERSIINAIYTRIALDAAATQIRHVRLDKENMYEDDILDSLNYCLTTEANIDQTAQAFIQDIVMSLFDEGVVAVVPTLTDDDPEKTNSYGILEMRTGRIVEWYPQHVLVELYDDRDGTRKDVLLSKRKVAIIENPLYAVMNEPNSTLQRLIRKLNLLDAIDEQSGSGKLDLIIQLPYAIKSESRRQQAEMRRKDIEMQLTGSKYGIAYTDATERVIQLNRAAENNLLAQIQYLTSMLHSQLGITEAVSNGTASEAEMLNYTSRTVEPIIAAIVNEFRRKFLTKTARTQKQTIMQFKDAFKFIPVSDLASAADKFTRNEILSSNEMRSILGIKPSKDPKADELRNKNLNQAAGADADNLTPDQTIHILETLAKNPETMAELDPQYKEILDRVIESLADKV